MISHFQCSQGFSDSIPNTIGVKQSYPFSLTLIGIFIDELEPFLQAHAHANNGCLLHKVLIFVLVFVDDVILLASTIEGLK